MLRTDFQQLANIRIEEARTLFAAGFDSGAYHLAGLAVEAAIKSCLAKMVQQHEFPDKGFTISCYEHNPNKLILAAQLKPILDADCQANANLDANWALVKDWRVESRYEVIAHSVAEDFLNAIDANPPEGIMAWLQGRW